MDFEKEIRVAIIQTTMDLSLTWHDDNPFKMNLLEEARIWREIRDAAAPMTQLSNSRKPHFILLPELSLHTKRLGEIRMLAEQTGSIVIGGMDYLVRPDGCVENRALVTIPRNWPFGKGDSQKKQFYIGKHYAAKDEGQLLKKHNLEFLSHDKFYILNAGSSGNIGISICADFYDIERYAIYKGRVRHIFILAYNQDVKSFYFLAEAISRLVYCNVVICNTGHYGGSIAFSLYDKEYKRYIYKHEGATLFTSQIISLPVAPLVTEQLRNPFEHNDHFKSQPPGYVYHYKQQIVQDISLNEDKQ